MTEDPKDPWKFKPGQSGNPTGNPRLPAHLRQFKQMSYEEFLSACHRYGNLTLMELKEIADNPMTTAFDLAWVNMIRQVAEGDRVSRELLILRLWGKPKEMEVDNPVARLSDAELLERTRVAVQILEAKVLGPGTTDRG